MMFECCQKQEHRYKLLSVREKNHAILKVTNKTTDRRADELIRAIAWSDEGRALVDDGGLVLVPWDFSRGHRAVPFADRGAQGAFFTSILLCTLTLIPK